MEKLVLANGGVLEIPTDQITEVIVINGVEYYLTPASQIQSLLDQITEHKADIKELKNCIVSVLGLLGLLDPETGGLKEAIKTGEEGYFKNILSALLDVVKLLGQAQIPLIGKKAEAELLEKFHFVKQVLPLIEKHGRG